MRAACEELADIREQKTLAKLRWQLEWWWQIRKKSMQFRKQLGELGSARIHCLPEFRPRHEARRVLENLDIRR